MTPAQSGRLGGLKNKGAANGNAKLTLEDVTNMRMDHARGIKRKDLAAMYGVHPATISKVTSGKRWAK